MAGSTKRTQPATASGSWFSLNGDLQTAEYHGVAWDAVSNRVIGGAQDTGTTELRTPGSPIFDSVSTGDGGDSVVEDRASASSSTRYSSFQFLSALLRRGFNASNTLTSFTYPSLSLLDGSPSLQAQFYTPLAVNHSSGTRLIIGANNGVYESLDAGDTITRISTAKINAFLGDPVVYGVDGNAGFLLFAAASSLFKRMDDAASLTQIATLPASVVDVSVDTTDANAVFAMTQTTVHRSVDGGSTFTAVTGNLVSALGPGRLRSMEFVSGTEPVLIVAANRGVYFSLASSGYSQWSVLGTGLPNAIVYELEYDQRDQILLAGTLGRGAWTLDLSTRPAIFKDGFE